MQLDKFGNEIKVGDYIYYACTCTQARVKVGVISHFSPRYDCMMVQSLEEGAGKPGMLGNSRRAIKVSLESLPAQYKERIKKG
jgi:hypothetical protein